jgi:Stage II sporulation protein E (SpoIIE)
VVGLGITITLSVVTSGGHQRTNAKLLALETRLISDDIAAAEPLYVEDHLGGAASLGRDGRQRRDVRPRAERFGHGQWGVRDRLPVAPRRDVAAADHARGHQAAAGPGRAAEPASSPVSDLNIAVYLGRAQTRASLLEASAAVPLRGTTQVTRIPFGDTVLTLTTSARGSLTGSLGVILPWAIGVGGAALTILGALLAERLVRRRARAERVSSEIGRLYVEQRSVAETLQRAILPDQAPAILGQLTRTMDIAEDGHFATVLCGLVDVSTHEVAPASAGHLPPLVCGGDGASLVQAKPGSPIGISGGDAFEPTLLTTAARGTLIAYTDGLVERRGETLDTGLKRLLQTATDRCGSSLDDLLTSLVSELTGDSPTDDIALIGLRWLN